LQKLANAKTPAPARLSPFHAQAVMCDTVRSELMGAQESVPTPDGHSRLGLNPTLPSLSSVPTRAMPPPTATTPPRIGPHTPAPSVTASLKPLAGPSGGSTRVLSAAALASSEPFTLPLPTPRIRVCQKPRNKAMERAVNGQQRTPLQFMRVHARHPVACSPARPLARSPARPLRAPCALCRRTRDNGSRPRPSERARFGAGTRKTGGTHRPDPLPWASIIDIQWLTSSNIPRLPGDGPASTAHRLDQI
jgi:hypothetical protein